MKLADAKKRIQPVHIDPDMMRLMERITRITGLGIGDQLILARAGIRVISRPPFIEKATEKRN